MISLLEYINKTHKSTYHNNGGVEINLGDKRTGVLGILSLYTTKNIVDLKGKDVLGFIKSVDSEVIGIQDKSKIIFKPDADTTYVIFFTYNKLYCVDEYVRVYPNKISYNPVDGLKNLNQYLNDTVI